MVVSESMCLDGGFTMVVYEKIYLDVYINKQYSCLKNNTE